MTDQTKHTAPTSIFRITLSTLLGAIAATLLSIPAANALEFQCQVPGDVRYIRVEIPGENHLCEVSVNYEYTGESKVMWHAQNDSLFCSARAYELRDKYEKNWDFACTKWPDRDGVDKLSASQRAILDSQLKALIEQGKESTPAFTVKAVKAVASTPLDNQAGTLALQYFLSTGDLTQIIIDESSSWEVFATIENLATHLDSDSPVSSALIDSISDSGALAIRTQLSNSSEMYCHGNQVLMVKSDNQLTPRTAHRYICESTSLTSTDQN
ncbi:MAG: hypothetical protein AB8B79_08685 [Granulosicoccus sp.]